MFRGLEERILVSRFSTRISIIFNLLEMARRILETKSPSRASSLSKIPSISSARAVGVFRNEYATISKVITSNIASDGMVEVSMSGIKDNVDEVELCMINRLRKRVVTFKQILKEDFPSNSDTIFMDAGKVDASMFEAIQANAFNASCVGCHGGNGNAVRGLFLTEGKSYAGLVGKASKVNPDMLLVNPGKAQESFLPLILEEDGHVAHSHIDILDAKKKTALVTLIKDWINNGAKE